MSPNRLASRYAGKRVTVVNEGLPQPFVALIKRFQCFSAIEKQDRFIALIMVGGDTCPLGTSNARHVATLAGLRIRREEYTATGQNHKAVSSHMPAAFT
jgi:hypothetical protein